MDALPARQDLTGITETNLEAEYADTAPWQDVYAFKMKQRKPSATEEDNEATLHADKDFGVTSLSDLCSTAASIGTYDPNDEHRQYGAGSDLAHYLPQWIVSEARDQYENALRRGDPEGGRTALEAKLKLLQRPAIQDNDCWRLNRAELLLDLDREEEARCVLEVSTRSIQTACSNLQPGPVEQPVCNDSDREYAEISKHAIQLLRLSTESGKFDQADEAIDVLRLVYPQYLNLDAQLDFFEDCRRHLRLGALPEAKSQTDTAHARKHLTEALRIYNIGCRNIEVRHFQADVPNATVMTHDHLDCANLFFSAARVCILFHEHNFLDADNRHLTPFMVQISPVLRELSWQKQALRFLERGRARALWDAVKRNRNLMDDDQSKTIDQNDTGFSELGDAVRPSEMLPLRQKASAWDFILDKAPWKDSDPQLERPFKKRRVLTDPTHGMTPRFRWHTAQKGIKSMLNTDIATHKILASIPRNTAVIEYALASSLPREKLPRPGLITIVTTSDGDVQARWQDLDRAQMTVHIESLLEALECQMTGASRDNDGLGDQESSPDHEECVERLRNSLISTLVEPARKLLALKDEGYKERLIIVPSGNLANAPWAMLFDKPLCVVPSLSIWERLNAERGTVTKPTTVFVTTKPRNNKGAVKSIQCARLEALHLAHLHEKRPEQADDHDTKSLEKLFQGRDLVHLTAHGEFNKQNPLNTSVHLLAQPLTIWDWYSLKVQAKLVVFSSCLSAVARTSDSGQGFGFSYALLSTGTRAFIGSLWPVNDEATLLFMMLFYTELRTGLSPADALFRAQNDLRELSQEDLGSLADWLRDEVEDEIGQSEAEEFVDNPPFIIGKLRKFDAKLLRNPAYWAAFTLVGHGFQPMYPASPQEPKRQDDLAG
jgi:CHAT domain-containing protein